MGRGASQGKRVSENHEAVHVTWTDVMHCGSGYCTVPYYNINMGTIQGYTVKVWDTHNIDNLN